MSSGRGITRHISKKKKNTNPHQEWPIRGAISFTPKKMRSLTLWLWLCIATIPAPVRKNYSFVQFCAHSTLSMSI